MKTVVIPKENERDLKEVPDNIKENLEIRAVKWIDEVLSIALERSPEPLSDEDYLADTPGQLADSPDDGEVSRPRSH